MPQTQWSVWLVEAQVDDEEWSALPFFRSFPSREDALDEMHRSGFQQWAIRDVQCQYRVREYAPRLTARMPRWASS